MKSINRYFVGHSLHYFVAVIIALFLAVSAGPAISGEYKALNGVKKVKAVFEVSLGSAKAAPVVFWAVRNAYNAQAIKALPENPEIAVVFHGPAVKLITSNREGFSPEESKALDKFADMIRQMKAEGVTFEVCLYAAKVLGVDPATILPEIDHVGNGFISVIGYQAQGYSVVRIP
jgi:intracellular sulfur oxidation DsrE/DsrF family protein